MTPPGATRRRFLAVALVATGLYGRRGASATEAAERPLQWLELTSVHTGEVVRVTFTDPHAIAPEALARLQHLLRDYRRNEEHVMDSGLYGLLWELARAAGCQPRYEVISGYRSPATNAQLREAGHAVAEHSQHMEGHAIDVRLKACPLVRLRDLALAARRGGVGYYPHSDFVHLDTGRVRSWQQE